MKQLFFQEVIIDDNFTYQKFLKKGFRTFSSLALKNKDPCYTRGENVRDLKSTEIVKIFKRVKLTRRVNLGQLQFSSPMPSIFAFLYIAKRLLHVKILSIYDNRRKESKYKGLFTTWPKYMKQLESLCFEIKIEKVGGLFAHRPQNLPKKMMFPSDFLRFLPRFQEAKVKFPFFQYFPQMDRVFQFQKYPVSMRKLSFQHPSSYSDLSIRHLQELRDLEIILFPASIWEIMNSAYSLISQAPVKLQALSVNFEPDFEIDASINKAIRRLINLKKAKIQLSSVRFADNLQILQSLEECPLESLDLKIYILHDQEILHITDLLLKKKPALKNLKLSISNERRVFEGLSLLEGLARTIDDLPKLANLSLSLLIPSLKTDQEEQLLSLESSLNFVQLFSKSIPLRKFRLKSDQISFSRNRFLDLLKSLREGTSFQLEKLQIDVGKYEPTSETDMEMIVNFIKSLVKIQVLKLDSLCVPKQYFSETMEAIGALRNLTDVMIGGFSEETPKEEFVESFGKILRKYGLRSFYIEISKNFKKGLDEMSDKYSSCLNFIDIKKKNPYIENCQALIKFPKDLRYGW